MSIYDMPTEIFAKICTYLKLNSVIFMIPRLCSTTNQIVKFNPNFIRALNIGYYFEGIEYALRPHLLSMFETQNPGDLYRVMKLLLEN